jgi:hypothetical protein
MSTLDMLVGISVSEPAESELAARGVGQEHVRHAYVELARQILAAGGSLAYGGSPQASKPNYVEILMGLLRTYSRPGRPPRERVQLYLAAPIWQTLSSNDLAPLQVLATVNETPPARDGSRHYTVMREAMTAATDARVIVGGRTTGYIGRWPGILEEAYLALRASQPLYIAGGLGGAAALAVDLVRGRARPDFKVPERRELRDVLEGAKLHNGLTEGENDQLFETVDLDLMVALIMRGLRSLSPHQATDE